MEYLIGAIVSGLLIIFANFMFSKTIKNEKPLKIKISQSRTHSMTLPAYSGAAVKRKSRQSINHFMQTQVRVLLTESYAYWIKDNAVYRADIKDGKVVEESTQVLDMMGMDKVQLDEMMFIIEQLTEGTNNDYWSSGDTKL